MTETDLPRYDHLPSAWRGPVLAAAPERWTHELTTTELAELDRVVRRLDADGRDIVGIGAGDGALPELADRLGGIRRELMHGIGFALIRGFPVADYSRRQAAIGFWVLGAQIGEAVSQNAKGHALGHVRDLGFDPNIPSARGYQSRARLAYHCDSGDVVGLLSLRTARSGGLSSLVSSVALYNAMVERRPDLARVLLQPTYRDRRDEIPEGRRPWYPMPVFMPGPERLFVHYVRSAIRKAQRFEGVPRITPAQEAAFDYLESLAGDAEFRLDTAFGPGDMQFLCNHTILHSRTAYEDWPEPERKRHLLRLWLACADGPAVPDYYAEHQGLTASGRPRGILCPGAELNASLEAEDGGAGESAKRLAGAAPA
ncbi:MAG: TauD/TfdA family dioxygenase [Alphaproteobacteria bacterium]|jgi:hypothetical protein|nr:TauD/TfdA family dioxygenase [Alphaproteobacteria bacterium]MDP6567415.1 TauD/TfdA family dioxygenase [Alphaproteobacteria bacterium]MDP6814353.1 TauD/TfdA family dioxygenase [Alphaproteobacteria bacterium]